MSPFHIVKSTTLSFRFVKCVGLTPLSYKAFIGLTPKLLYFMAELHNLGTMPQISCFQQMADD